ncbi:hypothetical protein XENOCAPTIV_012760 [Xenoophorus captivus]|uniref:dCMP deaminase n=1 Tax=Xenoophorus captivus TaxID=1517983 RepID=A0ABV0RQF8_9TELE
MFLRMRFVCFTCFSLQSESFTVSYLYCGTTRKREDYLEWPEYFMAVAFLSAQRSKDPSSQVSVYGQTKALCTTHLKKCENGVISLPPCLTQPCYLVVSLLFPTVCHAELNAIMNKNSADVKGCTMYVALFPCNECAKLIIQAGLKEVVYHSDKYHHTPEMVASRRLLSMAGVQYRCTPNCVTFLLYSNVLSGNEVYPAAPEDLLAQAPCLGKVSF